MNQGLLIVLGAILGIGVALLGLYIMKKRREAANSHEATFEVATAAPSEQRRGDPFKRDVPAANDPLTIQMGDLLEPGDDNVYAVRGTTTCTEGRYTWKEHFLQTETGIKRSLSVEEVEGDVAVVLWTDVSVSDVEIVGRLLKYRGVEYMLEEEGVATYQTEGTTGLPPSGSVAYADYEAPDGRHFARERFDQGPWEPAVGETVHAGSLTIYPGSDS